MTRDQAIKMLMRKPEDMPVFVLIGSDPCAQWAILTWLYEASKREVSVEKILSGLQVMQDFSVYAPKKIPD